MTTNHILMAQIRDDFDGAIVVSWPAPRLGVMPGWGFQVHDAVTGEQILTIQKMTVHLEAEGLAWAECVVFDGTAHDVTRRYAIAEMKAI